MERFSNKVCLVNGAASGIGYTIAVGFAKEKAKLVLADVNEEAGENVKQQIQAMGNEVLFASCNIANKEEV